MTIVRLPFADRAQGDPDLAGKLLLRQVADSALVLEPGAEGCNVVHTSPPSRRGQNRAGKNGQAGRVQVGDAVV